MTTTASIATKREDVQRRISQAKSILEQYQGALPAEKAVQVKALNDEIVKLQGEIDDEVKFEEAKKSINDADKWLNDPVHTVPHGINGDTDDQKALRQAGWELKDNFWHKQTSIGISVPMFGREVLDNSVPLPNDPHERFFVQSTRMAMEPGYAKAYANYIRAVATSPDPGMVMASLSFDDQKVMAKALSEGIDTAGGFLVPPDTQAELLARTAQMSVMMGASRVVGTSRDLLRWPRLKAHSTSGSIYSSAFVGSWVGETPSESITDPSFEMMEIAIRKARVMGKFSNDFIADAAVNVLAVMAQDGGGNMALVIDNGLIAGSGAALEPLGLLNSGLTTKDVEGSTSDTISNTVSNAGSAPKIIALSYALPAQYSSNARWLMSRDIEGKVAALVDGNGRAIWPVLTGAGLQGAMPATLMNKPIMNSDFVPSDGTNANKVMVYGDFQNFIVGQRAQITSTVLRERYAETDQTALILWARVGCGVANLDAFRVGIV